MIHQIRHGEANIVICYDCHDLTLNWSVVPKVIIECHLVMSLVQRGVASATHKVRISRFDQSVPSYQRGGTRLA